MLRRLEWQGATLNGFRCCPWCDGQERDGHEPGCELGIVALAARGPEAPRNREATPGEIHHGQEVDLSHVAFEACATRTPAVGRQRDRNRMAAVMASAHQRETAARVERTAPAGSQEETAAADRTGALDVEALRELRWRTERARNSPTAPLPFLTVAQADALLAALGEEGER